MFFPRSADDDGVNVRAGKHFVIFIGSAVVERGSGLAEFLDGFTGVLGPILVKVGDGDDLAAFDLRELRHRTAAASTDTDGSPANGL